MPEVTAVLVAAVPVILFTEAAPAHQAKEKTAAPECSPLVLWKVAAVAAAQPTQEQTLQQF